MNEKTTCIYIRPPGKDVLKSINVETLELGSCTHYAARRSSIVESETVQDTGAAFSSASRHYSKK